MSYAPKYAPYKNKYVYELNTSRNIMAVAIGSKDWRIDSSKYARLIFEQTDKNTNYTSKTIQALPCE